MKLRTWFSWGTGLGAGWIAGLMAAELREDFATDPFGPGPGRWQVLGEADLFRWDSVAGRLSVTWDSSRRNSFCVLPLPRTLTSKDTFSFGWDFVLTEAGPRPGAERPRVLQLGWALVQQALLPDGYPLRTSAGRAQNLVDFSFFPLSDYGPLGAAAYVSPAVFGQQNAAYSFGNPQDLADGIGHRIECHWDPAARRLQTAISGLESIQPTAPALPLVDDFAVDALAVVVWNEGATPADSLWASGSLDNLIVTLPELELAVGPLKFEASTRTIRFSSQQGFLYHLEGSLDLVRWAELGPAQAGTGGELAMFDGRKALFPQHFYRVRARTVP